jgi:hypothetical protein
MGNICQKVYPDHSMSETIHVGGKLLDAIWEGMWTRGVMSVIRFVPIHRELSSVVSSRGLRTSVPLLLTYEDTKII